MDRALKQPDRLLLDLPIGRYAVVKLAMEWLGILGQTDDGKILSNSDLVKKAIDDIISGSVTQKDIDEMKKKAVSHPVPDIKANSDKSEDKDDKDKKDRKEVKKQKAK